MEVHTRNAIEWECIRLNYAFAHFLDSREIDRLAALFAEDGVFVRLGEAFRGRNEIIKGLQHPPANVSKGAITRHVVSNFYFSHVSETRVQGVVYVLTYLGYGDPDRLPLSYAETPCRLTELQDVYTKTEGGWLFAERTSRMIFRPQGVTPMSG